MDISSTRPKLHYEHTFVSSRSTFSLSSSWSIFTPSLPPFVEGCLGFTVRSVDMIETDLGPLDGIQRWISMIVEVACWQFRLSFAFATSVAWQGRKPGASEQGPLSARDLRHDVFASANWRESAH